MQDFNVVVVGLCVVAAGACAPKGAAVAPSPTTPAATAASPNTQTTETTAVQVAGPAEPERPPTKPNPYVAPPVRTAGDLTVEAPPREREDFFGGRLRTHVDGALSKGSPRVWVGPQVPGFVALIEGTMELTLLDREGDQFLAFYRDPYGAGSCDTGSSDNCHYTARLYDVEGNVLWTLALHEHLSRPDLLEIQDIRYKDGALYFNEACQSYSSNAKGDCSALVAMDPVAASQTWRTRNLVSNGEFLVHGDYIVSGYGFTNERDYLFVVRRSDGKIMQKVSVPKSAETIVVAEDGLLEVTVYPGTVRLYRMQGWDGAKPKLVKTQRRASPSAISTGRH
ncbi:MAG: hypothetical protein K0V04_04780 [Deltaproteobacteria bacterium]|nr:hypothetical protein [Deltaproteobacteria bacterium]